MKSETNAVEDQQSIQNELDAVRNALRLATVELRLTRDELEDCRFTSEYKYHNNQIYKRLN